MERTQTTVYEQPLNERVRALLRLEYLFQRAAYSLDGTSTWDTRFTLDAILDVLAMLTRADLKSEIIKELERHAQTLEALRQNPGVDQQRLTSVLAEVRRLHGALRSGDNPPGSDLRQNELLSLVRQRSSIPAGTCSFDIPAFQHWLERPAEQRLSQLRMWLSSFDLIREAVTLCLDLIRHSASPTRERAPGGFFQRSIDPAVTCQMIRIFVPADSPWYPEVSGGRHRFTVRFMRQPATEARPEQAMEDVDFQLQCCVI